MQKYYIEEEYLWKEQEAEEIWHFLIPVIEERGVELAIVKNTMSYDVKLNRKNTKEPKWLYNIEKAFETNITRRPFMLKEEYLSITFHYKLNADILAEMSTEWLMEIKDTGLPSHFFMIKEQEGNILYAMAPAFKIALLYPKEVEALNRMGMKLQEWDISLNSII